MKPHIKNPGKLLTTQPLMNKANLFISNELGAASKNKTMCVYAICVVVVVLRSTTRNLVSLLFAQFAIQIFWLCYCCLWLWFVFCWNNRFKNLFCVHCALIKFGGNRTRTTKGKNGAFNAKNCKTRLNANSVKIKVLCCR